MSQKISSSTRPEIYIVFSTFLCQRSGLISKLAKDGQALEKEVADICDAVKAKSKVVVQLGKEFYYRQLEMGCVRRKADINCQYFITHICSGSPKPWTKEARSWWRTCRTKMRRRE